MSTLIFSVLVVVALGYFGRTIYRRFTVLQKVTPLNRFDNIPERVKAVLIYAFGQKKFVQREPRPETRISEQAAGWMHFFIFWGFTILAVQVITMFGRPTSTISYLPLLSPHLLGGPYLFLKDIMEVVVLGAISVALYRWGVSPPTALRFKPAEEKLAGHSHWEAYLILCFIGCIMIGGLLYDGGRMAYEHDSALVQSERAWQPFSAWSVRCSAAEPSSSATSVGGCTTASSWCFINLLPMSKHFHIITSLPNVFFLKTEHAARSNKMDLENAARFWHNPTSTSSAGNRCSICTRAPNVAVAPRIALPP